MSVIVLELKLNSCDYVTVIGFISCSIGVPA